MFLDKVNSTQRFTIFKLRLLFKKCVILPLKRFELRSCEVMLHLRGANLQLWLKPLRKLTHSVCSV